MLGCRGVAPPLCCYVQNAAQHHRIQGAAAAAPLSYYGRSWYSVSWSAQVTKDSVHAQMKRGAWLSSCVKAPHPPSLPMMPPVWRPWQRLCSRTDADAADADATRTVAKATRNIRANFFRIAVYLCLHVMLVRIYTQLGWSKNGWCQFYFLTSSIYLSVRLSVTVTSLQKSFHCILYLKPIKFFFWKFVEFCRLFLSLFDPKIKLIWTVSI